MSIKGKVFLLGLFSFISINYAADQTVYQHLTASNKFSKFLGWLANETKLALDDTDTQFTVFAPSDTVVEEFLKMPETTEDLGKYLLVSGNFSREKLKEEISVVTELGSKLWFSGKDDMTYANGAMITNSMMATNGHIHEIDSVIYPIGAVVDLATMIDTNQEFSGLRSLVDKATAVKADLQNLTAMFTVFSPTNQAVSEVPTGLNETTATQVVRKHVVSGNVIFSRELASRTAPLTTLAEGMEIEVKQMDDMVYLGMMNLWSKVTGTDTSGLNGVIHVINGVLGSTAGVNIYEALSLLDASTFETTRSRVAGIAEVKTALMNESAMFTVFSPNNKAWSSVSVDDTSKEKVLLRHVVRGKLSAKDVMNSTELKSMSGETFKVTKDGESVYLQFKDTKAKIVSTDNMASNGILHGIDAILKETSGATIYSISSLLLVISLATGLLFD